VRGRVDTTSKTLSARSQAVFLLSSIRGLLKVFMLGSTRYTEVQFEKEVRDRFAQPGARDKTYQEVMRLLGTLTERMTPWDVIVRLPPGQQQANVIPGLRQQYVNLTMAGLYILGSISHHVTTAGLPEREQVAAYEKVAALDWRRGNPLWRSTGFVKEVRNADGTTTLDVTRARSEIEVTVERVMEICALALD
jgi:hypothetical protein